jgi:ubiquinone/menaquinone biosynthesis C-methylase UbiE
MLSLIKKIKGKSKESFGDSEWRYNPDDDKKSLVLSWFFKLQKKSKILEAGCGTGNYVVSLTKMGHNVIGIDIDPERVNKAKDYMKKYRIDTDKIRIGDLTRLPFKDNSFDAVFCHGVIEHIEVSEKAVSEISRVLKKGGYAMISVPNRYTSFTISKIILQTIDKLLNTRLWNVGYEKSFSIWNFKKILSKYLNIVEFQKREVVPGETFPMYGKILRAIDQPLWFIGIGGGWLYSWCRK